MTTRIKTLISLSKREGGPHNIELNYDDATVEAITQAALDLIHMHRMAEGDKINVTAIYVQE